jgi:hypothetical protein
MLSALVHVSAWRKRSTVVFIKCDHPQEKGVFGIFYQN